jgi:hypothetical protein
VERMAALYVLDTKEPKLKERDTRVYAFNLEEFPEPTYAAN